MGGYKSWIDAKDHASGWSWRSWRSRRSERSIDVSQFFSTVLLAVRDSRRQLQFNRMPSWMPVGCQCQALVPTSMFEYLPSLPVFPKKKTSPATVNIAFLLSAALNHSHTHNSKARFFFFFFLPLLDLVWFVFSLFAQTRRDLSFLASLLYPSRHPAPPDSSSLSLQQSTLPYRSSAPSPGCDNPVFL